MKRMRQDIVQNCIWEQDNDLEDDQKDDGDDRDTFDMWDITVEDVKRIRQFLTPNVLGIIEDVIQPLIPTTQHTIPPNEYYVAPATKPILNELLEDKILNVAMVDAEADPTRDLEEPKRLLVEDPYFTKIQLSTKPYKVDREMKSPSRYGLKSSFPYPVANKHPNDVYCYFHPHLIPSEGMDTLLPSSSNKEGIETDSTRTHFKFGLVGYHAKDDDGIYMIVDVARRSKLEAWLRACCLFKSRGVSCSNSTLPVYFISLIYNRDIIQNKWGWE
ncbi:hypothetical protein Tco_1244606 [Tanacetum coccineum]